MNIAQIKKDGAITGLKAELRNKLQAIEVAAGDASFSQMKQILDAIRLHRDEAAELLEAIKELEENY